MHFKHKTRIVVHKLNHITYIIPIQWIVYSPLYVDVTWTVVGVVIDEKVVTGAVGTVVVRRGVWTVVVGGSVGTVVVSGGASGKE